MASSYKTLGTNDIVTTKTLLHEAIPITGTIVSGTYLGTWPDEENIKNYAHGMFQSVYDYPYLSSSANHIFDITLGIAPDSALSSSANTQNSKKVNLYNQFAQLLFGYDTGSNIYKFTDAGVNTGSFMDTCLFVPFSRLLVKDEIKKGSFSLSVGLSGAFGTPLDSAMVLRADITDYNAQNDYRIDSPAGEYGILYITGNATSVNLHGTNPLHSAWPQGEKKVGFIFYQAGIAVITGGVFTRYDVAGGITRRKVDYSKDGETFYAVATGSVISSSADMFRHRIYDLSFNNTTELNSTIYFCRAAASEFNYSSNTTYLTGSQIRVKSQASDSPVSYITTVGLYSPDNELLAVAKLSEPLKKAPDTEFTIRTRLDY